MIVYKLLFNYINDYKKINIDIYNRYHFKIF